MANNRADFLDHLTFSQRYGYAPLPEQMQLEEISRDLRREIWNVTRKLLISIRSEWGNEYYFDEKGQQLIERVLGKLFKKAEDEINTTYVEVFRGFKDLVLRGKFNVVLDLVETIANNGRLTEGFVNHIGKLFEGHAAAYRLDTTRRPFWFLPQTSKEQGDAVQQAIKTLSECGMEGADTHLRQAAEHVNARQYGDSIADSIHAVESVARVIDSKASQTLGPALDSLEKAGLLKHPALKEAFKKLYGYTSDEQGIRHALLDKSSPDVGLDEAVFMFGTCASFAAYLVSKHRKKEKSADQ